MLLLRENMFGNGLSGRFEAHELCSIPQFAVEVRKQVGPCSQSPQDFLDDVAQIFDRKNVASTQQITQIHWSSLTFIHARLSSVRREYRNVRNVMVVHLTILEMIQNGGIARLFQFHFHSTNHIESIL